MRPALSLGSKRVLNSSSFWVLFFTLLEVWTFCFIEVWSIEDPPIFVTPVCFRPLFLDILLSWLLFESWLLYKTNLCYYPRFYFRFHRLGRCIRLYGRSVGARSVRRLQFSDSLHLVNKYRMSLWFVSFRRLNRFSLWGRFCYRNATGSCARVFSCQGINFALVFTSRYSIHSKSPSALAFSIWVPL